MKEYKTALVTGASRGIGKAIALKLAEQVGTLFIVCSRSIDSLKDTADEIRTKTKVIPLICDVSDSAAVTQLFDTIDRETNGYGLDILVNNAGISCTKLLSDTRDKDWRRVIDTNLSSVFYCCRAAQGAMIRRQSGRILNVSSMWGQVGASMEVAYSASKGGVDAFTKSLAKELAPSNIQVNALSPGVTDTEMNDHLTDEEKASLAEEIPSGRFADTEEAAGMAVGILTAPDYLTGQIIRMDGGMI